MRYVRGSRIRPLFVGSTRSRWLVGGALSVVLVVAAACGSSAPSTATTATAGTKPAAVVVTTATSGALGRILVDPSGKTLYRYSPDGTGKSTCTGACAAAWPPLMVPLGTTRVAGAGGVASSGLGTIIRPGGARQVTFEGMPLYRFAGDTSPGEAKGQGVGGTWFVVSPSRAASPATTAVPAPVTTTTAPAAGYGY
jgi:predicted lipoprotein with Yx(FWY)xxD motif